MFFVCVYNVIWAADTILLLKMTVESVVLIKAGNFWTSVPRGDRSSTCPSFGSQHKHSNVARFNR